jgi:hypothetical protein
VPAVGAVHQARYASETMKRLSINPLGWTLIVLMIAALVAILFGSAVVQVVGLVVGGMVLLVLAADRLSVGAGRFGGMTTDLGGLQGTGESASESYPPSYTVMEDTPDDKVDREEAWKHEEALYRERQELRDPSEREG